MWVKISLTKTYSSKLHMTVESWNKEMPKLTINKMNFTYILVTTVILEFAYNIDSLFFLSNIQENRHDLFSRFSLSFLEWEICQKEFENIQKNFFRPSRYFSAPIFFFFFFSLIFQSDSFIDTIHWYLTTPVKKIIPEWWNRSP